MSIGILGHKLGMTRVYDDAGVVTAVTVIAAEPNTIVQIKGSEKDGYEAVQVGTGDQKESRLSKPLRGHFAKAGVSPKHTLREFRLEANGNGGAQEGDADLKVGDDITVNRFTAGQIVDVIGLSKGRGFQGVMKRHGFHGQPASHGSKMHRRPGGIGMGSTPGRIPKNTKMPGHMGHKRVTVQNLRIVQVREDDNVLLVKGAIPGAKGSLVVVRTAIKGQPREKQKQESKAMNPIKAAKKGK
ncbi:MAG: 50S ribosomal protein L3 [Verrucomicrobiota bacterium]